MNSMLLLALVALATIQACSAFSVEDCPRLASWTCSKPFIKKTCTALCDGKEEDKKEKEKSEEKEPEKKTTRAPRRTTEKPKTTTTEKPKTTKKPEESKEKSEEKSGGGGAEQEFKDCCKKLPKACMQACSYKSTAKDLENALGDGCFNELSDLLKCASNDVDHTSCCKAKKVGGPCLELCQARGPKKFSTDHADCKKHYKDIMSCHEQR